MTKQVLRNFSWEVRTKGALRELDQFLRLATVRGVHHGKILEELLADYNKRVVDTYCLHGIQLVDEADLLERLRDVGTPISRRTLWIHRNKWSRDLVPDGDGRAPREQLSFSDGSRRVVYNLNKCLAYFRRWASHRN